MPREEIKNALQWVALAVVAIAFQFASDNVLVIVARAMLVIYAIISAAIAFLQIKFSLERE